MPPSDATGADRPPVRRRALGIAIVSSIVVALAVLIGWAVTSTRADRPQATSDQGFERFRPGWASAMAKAGVEATYPAAPVDLKALEVTGSRSFDATFTAEEITALMNVYTLEGDSSGQQFSLSGVSIGFPSAGTGVLGGELLSDGSSYTARIEGPVDYSATGIDSPGATSLEVENFDISGARLTQASDAVIAYLNTYVRAAPGLVLEDARIVEGGLVVSGSAPQRITNP